jgi:hypothetical protein
MDLNGDNVAYHKIVCARQEFAASGPTPQIM